MSLNNIIIRWNRSCSARDSAYSYTFLRNVVCPPVVCHIRALCLNHLTDLHATWQVPLWGPMTHCVRWGPWPTRGREDLGVKPPAKTCSAAKPSVLCCHLANTDEDLGGAATAIPPFAKLLVLWSLVVIVSAAEYCMCSLLCSCTNTHYGFFSSVRPSIHLTHTGS